MALHKEDKRAAFTGFIAGGILILVMVLAIVQFTNAKFAGHSAGGSAPAGQSGH